MAFGIGTFGVVEVGSVEATTTRTHLQIYRHVGSGAPTSLEFGEPAFSDGEPLLRIGQSDGSMAEFRDAAYNAATFSPIAGSTSLITLGTITTGTWTATAIGPTKGGTGLTTCALGDLLYASGSNTWASLAANATATRKFLRSVSSGAPAWDTLQAGDIPDISATYQPLDSDLTAVAGLSSAGLVARTGSGTAAARTLTGTSNQIAITNGDGVSGNPTVAFVTSPVLPSGTTGTTQTAGDNSTKMATTAYVDGALLGAGSFAGLEIVNTVASPTTKFDVSADWIALYDGTKLRVVAGLSCTVDVSVNGAVNRLDTGTVATSTWYYIWAISNGSTDGALLSTSSTSPTMPSGYTYKRLIGAAFYSGSGFYGQYTWGNETFYSGGLFAVNAATTTTWTSVAITACVPPNATAAFLASELIGVTAGIGVGNVGPTSANNLWQRTMVNSPSGTAARQYNGPSWMPLMTSQTIWYQLSTQPGSDTLSVYAFGFKLNL